MTKAQDITPARAEALDEGAAGEREYTDAEILADTVPADLLRRERLHDERFLYEVARLLKASGKEYHERVSEIASRYAHPSPTPAADADRVRIDGDLAEGLARYLSPLDFENRRRSSRNQHAANKARTHYRKIAKRVLRFRPIAEALAALKAEGK